MRLFLYFSLVFLVPSTVAVMEISLDPSLPLDHCSSEANPLSCLMKVISKHCDDEDPIEKIACLRKRIRPMCLVQLQKPDGDFPACLNALFRGFMNELVAITKEFFEEDIFLLEETLKLCEKDWICVKEAVISICTQCQQKAKYTLELMLRIRQQCNRMDTDCAASHIQTYCFSESGCMCMFAKYWDLLEMGRETSGQVQEKIYTNWLKMGLVKMKDVESYLPRFMGKYRLIERKTEGEVTTNGTTVEMVTTTRTESPRIHDREIVYSQPHQPSDEESEPFYNADAINITVPLLFLANFLMAVVFFVLRWYRKRRAEKLAQAQET